MTEFIVNYATLVMDLTACAVIIWILTSDHGIGLAPSWHRLGLALIAIGLLGQAARDYVAITTGISPRDIDMPWWIFKDLGIFALAAMYVRLRFTKKGEL